MTTTSLAFAVDTAEVVTGNTAFAIDLYQRQVRTSPAENLFFSPYSISTALAMTYAGARGETATEMAKTLHFTLPPDALHPAFGELAGRFAAIQKEGHVRLSVANSLWCQRDYPFLPAFLNLNSEHYRAEAGLVDFAHESETARRKINTWVEQQTQDKIRELLQAGQITPDTLLVLCNAIYFKGDWQAQFDPKATRESPFFTAPGRSVPVPMMSRKLPVRSHANDGVTLFELPYAGKDLSMVIVLPEAIDGLSTLEERLTADRLVAWLAALDKARTNEAQVFLPRFKLNCRLDLAKDLAAMGMPSAFSGRADFSGMTGKRDLFIGAVVHQAFVDVNEEGTEAAAATAVVMKRAPAAITPVLRVDHPFAFLIRENKTGSVLFLGRVTDPKR